MRSEVNGQRQLFYQLDVESLIPKEHPIRDIKGLADEALIAMKGTLDGLYHDLGRPCIPPEQLLKALLLEALFSIRSHRQLEEQLRYNLMYRWFLDLPPDAPVWDHSTFTANNQRLSAISQRFLESVVCLAESRKLLSNEHFSVDGTLLEACASMKSLEKITEDKPDPLPPGKGGKRRRVKNRWVDFRGEKRSNQTHRSTSDPQARLYRKSLGRETKLAYLGHHLMDNRHGIIVEVEVTQATGTGEASASETMLRRVRKRVGQRRRLTVGEDKSFDATEHVKALRGMKITPHIAPKSSHGSGLLDGRTYCRPGYAISQRKRRGIEETFGWIKGPGGLRKLRHRGLSKVQTQLEIRASAYNLLRIANISRVQKEKTGG